MGPVLSFLMKFQRSEKNLETLFQVTSAGRAFTDKQERELEKRKKMSRAQPGLLKRLAWDTTE